MHLDFYEYRQLFYFFQYQFYIRGKRKCRDIDEMLMGRTHHTLHGFLYDLMMNPGELHYRWEFKEELPPSSPRENVPKGMTRREAVGRRPIDRKCHAIMPRSASKRSFRCRFMLFDWLRTKNSRRWNDFENLYRALIVFDLNARGYSFKDIADNWNNDFYFYEMKDHFNLSEWEKGIQQLEESIQQSGIVFSIGHFMAKKITHTDALFIKCYPDEFDSQRASRLAKLRIQKHYARAIKLIELAESGSFNQFPCNIPPL